AAFAVKLAIDQFHRSGIWIVVVGRISVGRLGERNGAVGSPGTFSPGRLLLPPNSQQHPLFGIFDLTAERGESADPVDQRFSLLRFLPIADTVRGSYGTVEQVLQLFDAGLFGNGERQFGLQPFQFQRDTAGVFLAAGLLCLSRARTGTPRAGHGFSWLVDRFAIVTPCRTRRPIIVG